MNERSDVGRVRAEELQEQARNKIFRDSLSKIASIGLGLYLSFVSWLVWDAWVVSNGNAKTLLPIDGENVREIVHDLLEQHRPIGGKTPREQINAILRECEHTRAEGHSMRDDIKHLKREVLLLGRAVVNIADDDRKTKRLDRLEHMQ